MDVFEAPDIVCALDLPPVTCTDGSPILGVATRQRPKDTPDDYSKVQELCEHAIKKGWRIRHIILGTEEVSEKDYKNSDDLVVPSKELIYTQDLGEIMRAIGECTAFASMKFHGTVVATMYDIPSIVLIPTNKNRNFMKRIGLENQVTRFDSSQLLTIFDDLPERLDTNTTKSLKLKA